MAPWFNLRTQEGLSQLDEFMRGMCADAKIALHVLIAANPAPRARFGPKRSNRSFDTDTRRHCAPVNSDVSCQ